MERDSLEPLHGRKTVSEKAERKKRREDIPDAAS
jgi:hypothetical protein